VKGVPVSDKEKHFGGAIPVLVTPYTRDHDVDPPVVKDLAARLAQHDCDGIFVAGSTGDMPFLSISERVELLKAARDGLPPHTVLYGGIGDFALKDHYVNARRFADVGVDVAVVMAPIIFFPINQSELYEYFRAIADNSPIPTVLYHHTRVTTPIEPETVCRLADHPNIIGMKETGASPDRTHKMLELIGKRDDFFILQGREAFLEESYRAGTDGFVAALAGPAPEPFIGMDHCWRDGDEVGFAKNLEMVNRLCGLFDIMPSDSFSYFTYTLKKMFEYRGWIDNSRVRTEGFHPSADYDALLKEKLEELDFPKE
jgi:4-hydroxy-tetrahydrodipicolinate synthase